MKWLRKTQTAGSQCTEIALTPTRIGLHCYKGHSNFFCILLTERTSWLNIHVIFSMKSSWSIRHFAIHLNHLFCTTVHMVSSLVLIALVNSQTATFGLLNLFPCSCFLVTTHRGLGLENTVYEGPTALRWWQGNPLFQQQCMHLCHHYAALIHEDLFSGGSGVRHLRLRRQ